MEKEKEMEKEMEKVIQCLADTTQKWNKIKKILEDEIRGTQEVIKFIDKYLKDRENKLIKLN